MGQKTQPTVSKHWRKKGPKDQVLIPLGPPHCADNNTIYMQYKKHKIHTNRNLLAVPRHRLNTYSGRAFAVTGPTVSRISSGTRQSALTLSDVYWRRICLHDTSVCSALEVDNFMRYINLLTYLQINTTKSRLCTVKCTQCDKTQSREL